MSIDEYRTSKKCKCDLENMYFKTYDIFGDCVRRKKVHTVPNNILGVNVACARTCMNRDVNASRNILEILEMDERPKAFQR